MSRRTSEASKAIRGAWANERELVAQGKGTRDWTEEQQRDILDGHSAHDDDGRAFEGHHMMSAETYPDFQGDPGNIQFLTRREHLEAHDGAWGNPTCGRYDPMTHSTYLFEDGHFIPCEAFDLSSPVMPVARTDTADGIPDQNRSCQKDADVWEDAGLTEPPPASAQQGSVDGGRRDCGGVPQGGGILRRAWESASGFCQRHPGIVRAAAVAAVAAVAAAAGKAIPSTASSSGVGDGRMEDADDADDYLDLEQCSSPERDLPEPDIEETVCSAESDYLAERSSPCEHEVRGYDRIQNGNTVHVRSYTRGGR